MLNSTVTPFKKVHAFEKRKGEADRVMRQYPDRIPIIAERAPNCNNVPLAAKKYLVPKDLTVGQFLFVIRKRVQLSSDQALFLFVNKHMVPNGELISKVHKENKDADGFLYFLYSGESTFGASS